MTDSEAANREPDEAGVIQAPIIEAPKAIVALGASAGGLRALQDFFAAMPVDSGLSFVVVQHLSPDFKSLMAELLGRHTSMAIHRVEDGMRMQPDAIYLIPPKTELTVNGLDLQLREASDKNDRELPIDVFFASLAEAHSRRACGIVLSGTGSDGSRGIQEIHRANGLVLVQSMDSAEFDGMPHAALVTRVADAVLTPTDMPSMLISWLDRIDDSQTRVTDPLIELLDRLNDACGIDFSGYKQTTVRRRVERRMGFRMVTDLQDYLALLSGDEDEIQALLHDLLIGVTGFFRDPDAFAALDRELQQYSFTNHGPDHEFRVWVAGCATGEEAYSIAMLLHRASTRSGYRGRIRVFATDVHRDALATASAGIYQEKAVEHLDEEIRETYFGDAGEGMVRVSQAIRDSIVFAPHNLLVDPPFTNLDLVTCRNLMIYFENKLQDYVLSFFQYALTMGGTLFLGSSEGIGRFHEDYDTLDVKWKLFRKVRNRSLPVRIGSATRPTTAFARREGPLPVRPAVGRDERRLMADYDQILRQCQMTGILIDEFRKPLHVFGHAGGYLHVAGGRFDEDLLNLLDSDLRIAVGTALQKTARSRLPSHARGVRVNRDGNQIHVDIQVSLASDGAGSDHYLIMFQDERPIPVVDPGPAEGGETAFSPSEHYRLRISDLEQELQTTKENLQATVEELQTTNEELQSTNEELQAANEEMQSANEELHSVNEELYTVNAEYEAKNNDLAELNKDHENLLGSLDTGTVFLDRHLRIRKYNHSVTNFFNLLPQDIGRPLSHIAYHLESHEELEASVSRVLASGEVLETELLTRDGTWLWKRALPFRRQEGDIDGVVLTFADISALKGARADAAMAQAHYEAVVENSLDGILLVQRDGDDYRITHANRRADEMIVGAGRLVGSKVAGVFGNTPVLSNAALDAVTSVQPLAADVELKQGDVVRHFDIHAIPSGDCLALTVQDRSDEVAERRTLAEERDAAEALNHAKTHFLATVSHELRTPLNGVIGAAELLANTGLDDEQRDLLETADLSAHHLLAVIDDMLDLARIERGDLVLGNEPYDLIGAIEIAGALFAGRAFAAGIDFVAIVDPDVPGQVRGDRTRLIQVLANLLGNAVKYTESGSVELRVQSVPGGIEAKVLDTGIGIPSDQQERIFEPFTQVDGAYDRNYEGAGLGLAICRHIVAVMGGTIALTSAAGQGTAVTLHLPLDVVDDHACPNHCRSDQSWRIGLLAGPALSREALAVLDAIGMEAVAGENIDEVLTDEPPAVLLVDTTLAPSDDELAALIAGRYAGPVIAIAGGLAAQAQFQSAATATISRPLRRCTLHRQLAAAVGARSDLAGRQPRSAPVAAEPQASLRVLVAEDNPVNQLVIQRQLEGCGHVVDLAADGAEALRFARINEYDLVLLDLLMPVLDGFQTAEQLRALGGGYAKRPILALTASTLTSDLARCAEVGIDQVLRKPMSASALNHALQAHHRKLSVS